MVCYLIDRWHRIGVSVFDQEVTLVYDCNDVQSFPLNRTYPAIPLDNEGIILLGRSLLSQDVFEVRH